MKLRKLTAVILALALLAVPVLSLGEKAPSSVLDMAMGAGRSVKTTVTFEPGEMLMQDTSMAPVADLLKSLRLETLAQQKGGAALLKADIFLQDKPSLSFIEVVEGDEFHLQSNLLGDTTISFTMEEYFQLLINQMEATGADEGLISFYKAYFQMYASLLKGELPTFPEFDAQSLQADLMMPLTEWFTKLMSSPDVTTGTFESDKHDTATVQSVYSLSAEQIAELLTIVANWAGKDVNVDTIFSFISTMSPDAGDLTADKAEFQKELKPMPEEFLKEAAPAMPEPFTVTTWMNDAGALVALEFKASIFSEDKEKPKDTILAGYYTKTETDGVNTELIFDVVSGTESFALNFLAKDADATTRWQVAVDVKQMGMDTFGMKLDFAGKEETAGPVVTDSWKLNAEVSNFGQVMGVLLNNTTTTSPEGADVKTEGKMDVYLTGQSAPVASVLYASTSGEPVEFPVIPEDSVRPGKMTAEELEAWGQELSMTMMMQMGQLMQNLPPSVLSTMNGTATY